MTLSDSVRVEAIAEGLLGGGRAEPPVRSIGGYLRLRRLDNPRYFYLIPGDGSRVLRGKELPSEELAEHFTEAMYRVGSAELGLAIVPSRFGRRHVVARA
jgi:hypothetical protein